MNRILECLLKSAGALAIALACSPALAQIQSVTDGSSSTTTCTSYTFNASGVLTFSPAGCLAAGTPPPPTPTIAFAAATSNMTEPAATTDFNVVVRRSGQDLTSPATVLVRWTGGTAVAPTNFLLPQFNGLNPPNIEYTINFPAAAVGVTNVEQNVVIQVNNAALPAGASRTIGFSLLSASAGNNLGATTAHTFTINSSQVVQAADVSTSGAAIPDGLATGTYTGLTLVCENFVAVNTPGTPTPGQGGRTPCGGYDYAVSNANRPSGAYNCNQGMANDISPATAIRPAITNSVTSATMFVLEDLKIGNTHIPGVDLRYPQHQYGAFIIKFRTGKAGEMTGAIAGTNVLGTYGFGFVAQENRGEIATRFAALSTKPCDFDYAKLDAGDACYKNLNQNGGGSVFLQVLNGGTPSPGKCGLQPDTVYYLSTRWEDVGQPGFTPARGKVSCTPGFVNQVGANWCGTSLAIN